MAGAPAVGYAIRAGARSHRVVCAVAVAGGAMTTAAYVFLQPWGVHSAALLAALAAGVCVTRLGLQRETSGLLRWDGERWGADWTGEALAEVSAVLDFQRWMLLRVRTSKSEVFWLWAESESARGHWLPLRRALASAAAGAPQEDSPARL